MKTNSINFDQIKISQLEIDQISQKYVGNEVWIPSMINRLKVEKVIDGNGLKPDFSRAVLSIKRKYDIARNRIKFNFYSGHYDKGTEWIKYSIKKQLYYFLTNESFPADYKYSPANPLNNERIQQEIVDRAMGWEYWCNDYHNEEVLWRDDERINKLLTNPKYKSTFDFPENYQLKDGQLASWALALLGKRMGELSLTSI